MPIALPLDHVLSQLRLHKDELREKGVLHAPVFGSTARGAARPDSDIADLLDGSVDVVNRKTLESSMREAILRDTVNAF